MAVLISTGKPCPSLAAANPNGLEAAAEDHCHLAYVDFCSSPPPEPQGLEVCCSSQLAAEWWTAEPELEQVAVDEVLTMMHSNEMPSNASATLLHQYEESCTPHMLVHYETPPSVYDPPADSDPSPFANFANSAAAVLMECTDNMPVRSACSAMSDTSTWRASQSQLHQAMYNSGDEPSQMENNSDLDVDAALMNLVNMASEEEAYAAIQMLEELSPEDAHLLCMDLEHNRGVDLLPDAAYLTPCPSNHTNDLPVSTSTTTSPRSSTTNIVGYHTDVQTTTPTTVPGPNAVLSSRVVPGSISSILNETQAGGFGWFETQAVSDLLNTALSHDTVSTDTANTSTSKKKTRGTRSKSGRARSAVPTPSASCRVHVQAAQRKRWGAGQLHPQQAQIDALLAQAGKPSVPANVGTNPARSHTNKRSAAAARRTSTASGTAAEGPRCGDGMQTEPDETLTRASPDVGTKSEAPAATSAAGPQKAARKPSNPYLAKGNALAAAVRAAAHARQHHTKTVARRKTSNDVNVAAAADPEDSRDMGSSASATAATAAAVVQDETAAAAGEPRAGYKRALYATVPPLTEAVMPKPAVCLDADAIIETPSKRLCNRAESDAEDGNPDVQSSDTAAYASTGTGAPVKSKPSKPQPATNRPPQPEGILKGILAEARTIGGRATIHSMSPQTALEVAAAVGTVASLTALSDDRITELLQQTEAANIAATAVAAAASATATANGSEAEDTGVAKKARRPKKVKRSHTTPAPMRSEITHKVAASAFVAAPNSPKGTSIPHAHTIHVVTHAAAPCTLTPVVTLPCTPPATVTPQAWNAVAYSLNTTMSAGVPASIVYSPAGYIPHERKLAMHMGINTARQPSPPPPPPPCSLLHDNAGGMDEDSDVMWQMINALEVGYAESY